MLKTVWCGHQREKAAAARAETFSSVEGEVPLRRVVGVADGLALRQILQRALGRRFCAVFDREIPGFFAALGLRGLNDITPGFRCPHSASSVFAAPANWRSDTFAW
mgnify:CR=1 FL=1